MNKTYTPMTPELEQLKAGLKAFFRIAEEWELNRDQCRTLLGNPKEELFRDWESGDVKDDAVSDDLLDRLSCLLGIYKSIKIMHSYENHKLFLTNKTQLAQFDYNSPLDYMLNGHLVALFDVRRYLEDKRL